MKKLYNLGVNRVSIGVQSLNNSLLKHLGRYHTAQKAIDAVEITREAGIENITIDLLYKKSFLYSQTNGKLVLFAKLTTKQNDYLKNYNIEKNTTRFHNEILKQAQMKQASTSPVVQQQSTITLPTPDQLKIDAEQEKEKMMKALSGIADNNKMMEKETSIEDLKPPSIPPPQFMANDNDLKPPSLTSPPFSAPPAAMMPPPPSFEIFEQQQVKQPPPPPAFNL